MSPLEGLTAEEFPRVSRIVCPKEGLRPNTHFLQTALSQQGSEAPWSGQQTGFKDKQTPTGVLGSLHALGRAVISATTPGYSPRSTDIMWPLLCARHCDRSWRCHSELKNKRANSLMELKGFWGTLITITQTRVKYNSEEDQQSSHGGT